MAGDFIQRVTHKGALHRALDVPEGQPIPPGKMAQARNSSDPHERRMAAFARELGKLRPQ